MNRTKITGLLLIIVGFILFLNRLDVLHPSENQVWIILSALGGVLFLRRGMIHEHHRGLFLGVFLLTCSAWLTAIELNILEDQNAVYVGMLFLSLCAGYLTSFFFRPDHTIRLFLAIISGILGGLIIMTNYHMIAIWKLEYILETFWPLSLVLLGVILLLDRFLIRDGHSQ